MPVHERSSKHHLRLKQEQSNEGSTENPEIIVSDGRDEKIAGLENDKEKIILELMTIKKDNQRTYFQLQKTEAALRAATLEKDLAQKENKDLRQSNAILGAKLTEQQLEMERVLELTAKDKKTISNLYADKKQHLAKISQLQRGLKEDPIEIESDAGNESTVYKLDEILAHKKKYKKMFFLVSWEGFGPDHNTWEPESNILCQSTLDGYKKTHNLN